MSTINAWIIEHARLAETYLGRDGVRDFPLLFREQADAASVLAKNAQITADWNLVKVQLTPAES